MNFNKNVSVKNVNGKIKLIIILVLTILLFLIVISGSKNQNVSQNQMNDVLSSTNEYQEKIAITSLKFNEKEIELDIKETKDVILEISPENANIDNLEICTSDNNIATIEKSSEKNFENAENTNNTAIIENSVNSINTENTENVENLTNAETIEGTVNKIILKIKPISEGECEAYAKSNEVISNKIKIKVIDKEKIEREKEEQKAKQEREKEEQKAKQEKEEQEQKAKKEKEEQEQKTKQEKKTQEQKTNQKKQNTTTGAQINRSSSASNATSQKKQTSSSSNSNNSHGKLVYATPKGKRYHFDPDCGGKNSYQTTLDAAKARGLTPCNKCAK